MTCPEPEKFFPANTTVALRDGAMRNKVALITGGGTGIGKAIAMNFAALGAKVAVAARRMDVLESAAAEIRAKTGGVCEAFRMDIKDQKLVSTAIDEIEKRFGQTPNVLVNNAAGNFIMATERLSDNAASTIVDIVLKGTMRVTREVGARCIRNGTGCAVLTGAPFVVPSAMSKAGVEIMTKSLSTEWGKYGIRLNVIAPGPFPTEGAFGRLTAVSYEQAIEAAASTVPAGRCGELEELANLAAFLCSDYGNYISGAIIDMDGGQQFHNHNSSFGANLHEMSSSDWADIEKAIRGRTNKSKV
ncbi:hypothetical protein PRIPAC_79429 [Pristionchus pacificus]|uniref:Dehydrogenase n=1 Tax=Pristionchus pacificus TaxID=54126 RepID=A0A2A6CKX8_PRIPA|nr:hypothetical protein PRIPAC_79429 [Pristionchus pacificus]|eukprot:PDM78885.1 dehydrogenase [Pristionchus pacificus]